jgi:hypothetical protein
MLWPSACYSRQRPLNMDRIRAALGLVRVLRNFHRVLESISYYALPLFADGTDPRGLASVTG